MLGTTDSGRHNSRQPPWGQERAGEERSFGSWLRRQREMREIALRQISDTSKINIRFLEALEQDRFEILPAPIFAKGFLREYAKYVGLDPDEVVNYYLAARQAQEPEGPVPEPELPATPQSATHWTYGLFLTAGVLVIFGVVAALSWYAEQRRTDQPPPMAPMAAPPVTERIFPPPSQESESDAPLRVTLYFTQNCQVEALIDGEPPQFSEVRAPGESLRFMAQRSVRLTLGNMEGVSAEVNGRPFPLTAAEGETIHIDMESVALSEGNEP